MESMKVATRGKVGLRELNLGIDKSETNTKLSSTVTFGENCEILGTKLDNRAKSLEDLDNSEESTLEHIILEGKPAV